MNETHATSNQDEPTTWSLADLLSSLVGRDGNDCCFAQTRGVERKTCSFERERSRLTTQTRQPPARENEVSMRLAV